jgi:hypothetical protein
MAQVPTDVAQAAPARQADEWIVAVAALRTDGVKAPVQPGTDAALPLRAHQMSTAALPRTLIEMLPLRAAEARAKSALSALPHVTQIGR